MEAINIVGGGIAGLALAAGLDPERHDVTVHEQRPGLPTVETSLAMWPEAQGALAVLGILPEIKAVGATFGGMALRDAAGGSWASPEVRGVVGVSRADLIRLLDAAVPRSVRRTERKVEDIPAAGPLAAGLVVGADGVHSVVRRAFWGQKANARLTPYLALRGVLPVPVAPEAGGEYWGRGQLFGITPASGGRTYWYASFRSELRQESRRPKRWSVHGSGTTGLRRPSGTCWSRLRRNQRSPSGSGPPRNSPATCAQGRSSSATPRTA